METKVKQKILDGYQVKTDWHSLGIITGLSPASSKEYYWQLCEKARERFGGHNCPEFLTANVNFGYVEALMDLGEWTTLANYIAAEMIKLEMCGAHAFAVCSNTIHKILENPAIISRIRKPVIHIGDCVAEQIARLGLERVGFIGTKTTMSEHFILNRLAQSYATVYTPPAKWQTQIDSIIFNELCKDMYFHESRRYLLSAIDEMVSLYDIQGVVLGCTELPLSITSEYQRAYCEKHEGKFHFFDSEEIHINALLDFCADGKLPGVN